MESHLLQMRGLKQDRIDRQVIAKESHLLQMRGLKLRSKSLSLCWCCRIFYRCVD